MGLWNSRWLGVPYSPRPEERSYLERAEVRKDDTLVVRASVLANRESERFFGVPLPRRGIQPVWLEITNHGPHAYRLRLASLDPNYYPPLEAAYANPFHIVRRILGFGVLALRFRGRPVWVGQISRDIGVRFTPKTWTSPRIRSIPMSMTRATTGSTTCWSRGTSRWWGTCPARRPPAGPPRGATSPGTRTSRTACERW